MGNNRHDKPVLAGRICIAKDLLDSQEGLTVLSGAGLFLSYQSGFREEGGRGERERERGVLFNNAISC